MLVINAMDVNHALQQGIELIKQFGIRSSSRGGDVITIPEPVTTVYTYPNNKVLINSVRDANPFFHLFEALWILAGRADVKFLTEFNGRMAEYSDDGQVFNAPYGYRMRNGVATYHDQINDVIKLLKNSPDSRQAVIQIWDDNDVVKDTKDKACNMSVVFRIRENSLTMTVYNRSNDMIWGAYGANVVQFSTLQEYVAAHLDVPVGTYYQVSNDYHVYLDGPGGKKWDELQSHYVYNEELYNDSIGNQILITPDDIREGFDEDLKLFFETYDKFGLQVLYPIYKSEYFTKLVIPMLYAFLRHKSGEGTTLLELVSEIHSDDWRMAAHDWLQKRGSIHADR